MTPTPANRWRRPGLAALALAVLALALAWVARGRSRPGPDGFLARALADHEAGRDREARESLARLAELREPTPDDRLLRAQVAGRLGEDPLPELAPIPDGSPPGPAARLLAGRVELSRGRLRRAEAQFLAALARGPDDPRPRRELAYIYALQHRLRDLDGQFTALAERNQLDEKSLLIWGRVRCATWNPTDDLGPLRKAVAADPDDRASRLALADGLLVSNRPDEAEAVLAPLPEADPEARVHRFAIAMARDDADAAEAILDAPDGSAESPRLLQLRGNLALTRGQVPEAIAQFRAALALDPADRVSQNGLGTALKLAGREAEARPFLDAARSQDAVGELVRLAAVERGSGDPAMPRRLGIACARAGRTVEARAWLGIAIDRDPLDPDAQKALADLDRPAATPAPAPG